MPVAMYIVLHFEDAEKARGWLKTILPQVTHGEQKPKDLCLQLALTYPGLKLWGAGDFVSHGFAVEFMQGMDRDFRARVLGDNGDSCNRFWRWGARDQDEVHALAMVYAPDVPALHAWADALEAARGENGLVILNRLEAAPNPLGKEHFGFRDGLSQPTLKGLVKPGREADFPEWNVISDGEFILGYPNGYNLLPDSPMIAEKFDPDNVLTSASDQPGFKDFGRNGSYMIFRHLEQDVAMFWEQIGDAIRREQGTVEVEACIQLASKMVGRWPNGTPISESTTKEGPDRPARELNGFQYAEEDLEGKGCPWGSHIRRSNPRDAMPDNKPSSSTRISNLHRILRRGRIYGAPLAPDFDPRKMVGQEPDGQERGLFFICFNTNISRQFEFVQHTWCNNTKFAGLYQDPDPILGIRDERAEGLRHDFTMPGEPFRRKVQSLTRNVHVKGGGYFFMPGLRALQFLADFKTDSPHV